MIHSNSLFRCIISGTLGPVRSSPVRYSSGITSLESFVVPIPELSSFSGDPPLARLTVGLDCRLSESLIRML